MSMPLSMNTRWLPSQVIAHCQAKVPEVSSQTPALCSSDISNTKSGVRVVELQFRRLKGAWWPDWQMSRRGIGFWVSSPGHGSNDMSWCSPFFFQGSGPTPCVRCNFLQVRYWFSGKYEQCSEFSATASSWALFSSTTNILKITNSLQRLRI